jgi:heme oxygenase (biliverdin-IX-beta and delta-forming)
MRAPACAKEIPTSETTRIENAKIGTVHRVLRTATRDDHASIDRTLLRFDLHRAEDYRTFLCAHFAALASLQAEWRLQDDEDFAHMLGCLKLDLTTLGYTTVPPIPPRTPSNAPRGLGIAYVVRGSRLGAAVLRRRIAAEHSTTYLDFIPALSWAEFLPELESIADDPTCRDEAIRAARNTFRTFATEFTRLAGEAIAMPAP